MIKLSTLIQESTEEYRADWIERRRGQVKDGRLLAYHGTPTKNLKSIQQNGFKQPSYFSLRPQYSKQIAATYHNVPENRVTVIEVWLPLDAIDFVAGDVYSTRVIKYEETL
jgi:hypothetical protein